MTTERIVTLKVDTSLLFDCIKQMGGNCAPLGERLVSLLLSTVSLREMIGLLGVYGIEIEDAADLAAANERIARLEGVATAALRRARAVLSVAIRAAVEDIDFDPREHHAIKDIDAALATLSPAGT